MSAKAEAKAREIFTLECPEHDFLTACRTLVAARACRAIRCPICRGPTRITKYIEAPKRRVKG